MKIDRSSLLYRVVAPAFFTLLLILSVLIFSIYRVTNDIIEDFESHALSGYVSDTTRIIEMAQTDLTTARLLDNPPVVEAKKKLVLEAISLKWQRGDLMGVVTRSDGQVLLSSLPADLNPDLLGSRSRKPGLFHFAHSRGEVHGMLFEYPAWGWRISVATRSLSHGGVRREVLFLIPIVVLGSALIMGTLFVLLRRNLQQPVSAMVEDVKRGHEVRRVGIDEFDILGSTINNAFRNIEERNDELTHELEEREKAESSVREKESQIRLLLDSAAEGICGVDTRGVCIFCNPSALRLLGFPAEQDLLGKSMHALVHHSHADGSEYPERDCLIYRAFTSMTNIHAEHDVFWRADGTSFPVEYWSFPMMQSGECAGAIVTFFDITERTEAQARLREEKNKFESIISAMGDGVSIQDRDLNVLYQNEVHTSLTGSHAGEKCYRAYEYRDDICPGCPVIQTFQDGGVHRSQRTVEQPGGAKHFDITTSPLRDGAGAIVACIELVRDVTDRRRADEHLYHAQRMESIGLLAGGIAHDFNNILSAIFGYAEMLQMDVETSNSAKSYINQILAAAERATGLTKSLLAFSSKQAVTLTPLNINDTVYSFHRMLKRLVGEDIEFKLNLYAQMLMVEADRGQIEQVLMNLVTNARDAMPQGGCLQIQTEMISLDEDWGEIVRGRYAVLAVSDTGSGMTSHTLQHIFEPFFTTKEVGRGTGLGLAIVYGIVKNHRGYIHVYSEPGKGTTFKISLPLLASWQPKGEEVKIATPASGTETLLLVEDEKSVRTVTTSILTRFGYSVIEAVDGEDAVRLFRDNRDRISLVLSDLVMPRKDGREARDEIRAIQPDIKWIFMSGYTADIISRRALLEEGVPFISKPLVPSVLLSKIREVLDS